MTSHTLDTIGYDELDRVTSYVEPSGSYGDTYDANGNRTQRGGGGPATTYTLNVSGSRISTVAAGGPTVTSEVS